MRKEKERHKVDIQKLKLEFYEETDELLGGTFKHHIRDAIWQFIEHKLSIPMDAEVKPACEMERPTLENFLPKGTTIRAITNMFLANPTLYAYINTLDEYIDKLESKSV